MSAKKKIQKVQREWAKSQALKLTGGTIRDGKCVGEKNYVKDVSKNLYEPLTKQSRKEYEKGDGQELQDKGNRLAKMKALHSSSALVVNFFQYWRVQTDKSPLLNALGLTGKFVNMEFERQLRVCENKRKFPKLANLDVMLSDGVKYVGIESKFAELYANGKSSFSKAYFAEESLWKGLSALHKLAQELTSKSKRFKYLDAAQLIKHILALRNSGAEFELLYLWYDVDGEDGRKHCEEADEFANIAKNDGVQVRQITYQKAFSTLKSNCGNAHKEYCNYLEERYF